MGEPNSGGGVLPPIGEEQQPHNPVLGGPTRYDDLIDKLDLDKLHNQYVIDQLNKLVNDIFEYNQLDNKHKLHHLIDHDYATEDEHDSGNDDGARDNDDAPLHLDYSTVVNNQLVHNVDPYGHDDHDDDGATQHGP